MAMTDAVIAAAGKYLTFALAGEEHGLPVLKVREIIKMMHITPVPRAPGHVKGVINLRGKVVPVIDLRLKFGLETQPATDRTCIIVVDADGASGRVLLGIAVDEVSEVLNIVAEEIETPPDFGERLDTRYLQGVAKVKDRVLMLLDLDQVVDVNAATAVA